MVERFVYTETVNGSSPLLPKSKMFNIGTLYNIFLSLLGISTFIFFGSLYLKISKDKEIIYKAIYFMASFILTYFYLWVNYEKAALFLFIGLENVIILKDPQDLVTFVFEMSFFVCTLLVINVFWVYLYTYFQNNLANNTTIYMRFGVFNLMYYTVIATTFAFSDLFFSSWEAFATKSNKVLLDFQPDFYNIILNYKGDLLDILFVGTLFIVYFHFLLKDEKIVNFILFPPNRKIRFLLSIFWSLTILYFIGGNTLFEDIFLFGIGFALHEVLLYFVNFIFIIKKYK